MGCLPTVLSEDWGSSLHFLLSPHASSFHRLFSLHVYKSLPASYSTENGYIFHRTLYFPVEEKETADQRERQCYNKVFFLIRRSETIITMEGEMAERSKAENGGKRHSKNCALLKSGKRK